MDWYKFFLNKNTKKKIFNYFIVLFITGIFIYNGIICMFSYILNVTRFLSSIILLFIFSSLFGYFLNDEESYLQNALQFMFFLILIAIIFTIVTVKITHRIDGHDEIFNTFNELFTFLFEKQSTAETLYFYRFFNLVYLNFKRYLSVIIK